MKIRIDNYSFDASEKKVTFLDYAAIEHAGILLIVNVTDNVIIYNFADPTLGGTVATNVVTLTYDTTSMDDADKLLVYYDDAKSDNAAVAVTTTLTRPADTASYAAGDSVNTSTSEPTALEFAGCTRQEGEGGYLNEVQIETSAVQFASKTVRLWLYNATPATLTNDNAAMLLDWDDRAKRLGYVDVTFDAVVGASDMVMGKASPMYQFVCASGSTSLYGLVQTLSAVTDPANAGVFNIILHIVQL